MRDARPLLLPAAALLIAAVGALSGCRSGSAVHGRYSNFRAYYNTYYNASQKLEEGEKALLNVNTPVDRTQLVPLFPTGAAAAGRTPVFDAAIDKSAELLRQRPGSKWADDALLVIGKAYFYESNFVGADQKFRETITAAEITQNRRLADEARFWLGRTMAAADRYDEGVLVLRQALEQPDGDRYWTPRMHLALGELYARAGRWDAAAADLRDGIEGVRDADLAARGSFLLGQVEESAERYSAAAEAYQAAADRRPAYEVAFAAEINHGLVLGLDAGEPDAALAQLRAMGRDDKNYARRAEVALAQARVLAASGQSDAARTRFREVLYDSDLAGQNVRGEAHYRLAEFYRDALGDYVTAAAHFDTAATAIQAPPATQVRASRAAIVGAAAVATTYETVARTSLRIAGIDSLLALGALSEDDFRTRVAEIESVRRAEWLEQRRQADALRTAQDFGGQATEIPLGADPSQVQNPARGVTTPGVGGNPAAAAASNAEGGFLGFRDPRTIQSGLLSFQRIYGDRPLVPDWRRRAAVQGGLIANSVGLGTDGTEVQPGYDGLGGPPPLNLSNVPRTPGARALVVVERASLRYELANTFFLGLARPDLAATLYQQILAETPDAPVAERARYALAELETAGGRAAAAAPLYQGVAAGDSASALGQAALARLEGREPTVAAPEVDRRADRDYAAARALWDDGDPYAAAVALVALGNADPDAPEAPRAFLAAALAYSDWAQTDSVALSQPLPLELVPAALDSVASAAQPVPDAAQTTPASADDAGQFSDESVPTRGSRRNRQAPRPARQVAPGDEAAVPLRETSSAEIPPMVEAPADSTGQPESASPPPADSLAADSLAADSLATSPLSGMTLDGYLKALSVRYSDTPYATRAQAMAATLTEETAVASGATVAYSGLRGAQQITPVGGGYSWVFGPFASFNEASARIVAFGDPDLRTAIAERDGQYAVLLGLFATEDEAQRVQERETAIPFADAAVSSIDGLRLIDEMGRPVKGQRPAEAPGPPTTTGMSLPSETPPPPPPPSFEPDAMEP